MPTMGAPESVMTFNAFNVTIRSSGNVIGDYILLLTKLIE